MGASTVGHTNTLQFDTIRNEKMSWLHTEKNHGIVGVARIISRVGLRKQGLGGRHELVGGLIPLRKEAPTPVDPQLPRRQKMAALIIQNFAFGKYFLQFTYTIAHDE
jgi:hypothetical protein